MLISADPQSATETKHCTSVHKIMRNGRRIMPRAAFHLIGVGVSWAAVQSEFIAHGAGLYEVLRYVLEP
ncbi:MAG: hypothetical protein ACT4PZ_24755, partial [Panacagrimonas sp.]